MQEVLNGQGADCMASPMVCAPWKDIAVGAVILVRCLACAAVAVSSRFAAGLRLVSFSVAPSLDQKSPFTLRISDIQSRFCLHPLTRHAGSSHRECEPDMHT